MSSPLNLSLSSEIVSAMSSLNTYPDRQNDVYLSELYPETILAMQYLNLAMKSISILVVIDFNEFKLSFLNKNIEQFKSSLSISDQLEYRKNLLLAKDSLLSIKHLEPMIEHSIEHINSALSFTIIKLNDYFFNNLFFKLMEENPVLEFEDIKNYINDYISLESILK